MSSFAGVSVLDDGKLCPSTTTFVGTTSYYGLHDTARMRRRVARGLVVRNVTPRSIILGLRPDCSRPFNRSVTALFSDSYAPFPGNQLIASSCSPAAQLDAGGCSVTGDRMVNRLSSHCSANQSIICIPPPPPPASPFDSHHHHHLGAPFRSVMDRTELLRSNCTGLVSSLTYNDAMGPTILLDALELDWWVSGPCRCAVPANCTLLTQPTTGQETFKCECPEGFEGDGFIDGTGCQSTASSHQRRVLFAVVGAVTAVLLLLLSIPASILFRRCRRRNTTKQPLKAVTALFRGQLVGDEIDQGAAGPRRFSYDDLAAATDNFSDDRVLGRGGFGSVYRGFLSDMNREVAVKEGVRDLSTRMEGVRL